MAAVSMHSCITLWDYGSVQRHLTLVMWSNEVLRDGGGGTKHDFCCLGVLPAAIRARSGDDACYASMTIGESNAGNDCQSQLLLSIFIC